MFRKIIFWAHLVAGLIAGLAIGVMCFTGTALAFEKELLAWAERDARRVEPPAASAPRLSLEEMQRRLREAQPEARPMNIVFQNDPRAAVAFTAGRTGGFYVNPYTGEVRAPAPGAMAGFMRTMNEWHRYLGFGGEVSRPRGKLANGIGNVAFCVLAISGLYLWMPRTWTWRGVKAVAIFNGKLAGKARDFNWHNVIGLWCAPVLIVLTLTAMPISFRWASNLIFTLTGTPAPAAGVGAGPGPGRGGGGGGGGAASPAVDVPTPPAGAQPLTQDALLAAAQRQSPEWKTITLRAGGGGGGGRGASQAFNVTVREANSWPRTANTTLALNPYTGEVLRRSGYADQNAAQRVRAWTRFLHTGEALGPVGQWIAGLACLGGCFLVYTGFALAWRRFFGKAVAAAPAAE